MCNCCTLAKSRRFGAECSRGKAAAGPATAENSSKRRLATLEKRLGKHFTSALAVGTRRWEAARRTKRLSSALVDGKWEAQGPAQPHTTAERSLPSHHLRHQRAQWITHDSTKAEPPFPGRGFVVFGGTPNRWARQTEHPDPRTREVLARYTLVFLLVPP